MRRVAALCCLLMAVPIVAATRRGDGLYGLWEPLETSRGGLGAMVEFTPQGKFIRTFGALVRGRYVADSASLAIQLGDGSEPARVRVRVSGDTLVQYAPVGADSQVMTRTRSGAGGVQGEWTYRHRTGATAFMRFRADSTMRLWIRMRTDTTPYEIRGDTIVTSGATPMWLVYRATQTELELRNVDTGRTLRYTRDRE